MDANTQTAPNGKGAAANDIAAQLSRLEDELASLKETLGKAHASGCDCAACAEEASKMVQHAKEQMKSAMTGIEGYLRDNPRVVIGSALGVGVLLGILLRRH